MLTSRCAVADARPPRQSQPPRQSLQTRRPPHRGAVVDIATMPIPMRAPVAATPSPTPGELDAWLRQVYAAHGGVLLHFLAGFTGGDRYAAQDLLQEVLLRALRYASRLDGDVATLRPWLFTVGRRLAIDAARARRVRPSEVALEPGFEAPSAPDLGDGVVDRQALLAALGTLSPSHRQAVEDLYLAGLSVAQSAELRGVPAGTVKSRAFYALRQLRGVLAERADPIGA